MYVRYGRGDAKLTPTREHSANFDARSGLRKRQLLCRFEYGYGRKVYVLERPKEVWMDCVASDMIVGWQEKEDLVCFAGAPPGGAISDPHLCLRGRRRVGDKLALCTQNENLTALRVS